MLIKTEMQPFLQSLLESLPVVKLVMNGIQMHPKNIIIPQDTIIHCTIDFMNLRLRKFLDKLQNSYFTKFDLENIYIKRMKIVFNKYPKNICVVLFLKSPSFFGNSGFNLKLRRISFDYDISLKLINQINFQFRLMNCRGQWILFQTGFQKAQSSIRGTAIFRGQNVNYLVEFFGSDNLKDIDLMKFEIHVEFTLEDCLFLEKFEVNWPSIQ
eukprot:gene12268-5852_t